MPVKSRYRREKEKREAWEKYDKLDIPRFLRGRYGGNEDLALPKGYERNLKKDTLLCSTREGRSAHNASQRTNSVIFRAELYAAHKDLIDGSKSTSSVAAIIARGSKTKAAPETIRRHVRIIRKANSDK